jgi:rhamnosyltransferase
MLRLIKQRQDVPQGEDCCGPNNRPPSISVLVRVKNEMQALPEFWRRLRSQTCFADCEVVFLDSGSTDGTLAYLATLPCSVWQIAPEEFQFGSSCNLMMELSQAPIAVFLSGHVLLSSPIDLARAVACLKPNSSEACFFRQVPNSVLGCSSYEKAFLRRRFPANQTCEPIALDAPAGFSNAACAITRAAWVNNRFPEVVASEDYLWAKRHLESGGSLYYLPHIAVMHSHNEPAEKVFRRVRINVEARGLRRSYLRAAMYLTGIFGATLREGASVSEAWRFASAHSRAYA